MLVPFHATVFSQHVSNYMWEPVTELDLLLTKYLVRMLALSGVIGCA